MENLQHSPEKEKSTRIFVNTQEHFWDKKKISFEDLINLAFPGSTSKEYDVTYVKGHSNQEGELLNGDSVPVHPDMEFIITPTNES